MKRSFEQFVLNEWDSIKSITKLFAGLEQLSKYLYVMKCAKGKTSKMGNFVWLLTLLVEGSVISYFKAMISSNKYEIRSHVIYQNF